MCVVPVCVVVVFSFFIFTTSSKIHYEQPITLKQYFSILAILYCLVMCILAHNIEYCQNIKLLGEQKYYKITENTPDFGVKILFPIFIHLIKQLPLQCPK